MAVAKEWGGHGTDFVTQALVMAELAKADSANRLGARSPGAFGECRLVHEFLH